MVNVKIFRKVAARIFQEVEITGGGGVKLFLEGLKYFGV